MLHTHIPDAKTAELAGETFIGPLSQIPRQYTCKYKMTSLIYLRLNVKVRGVTSFNWRMNGK
jgi:hypothetical protein